MQDEPQRAFWPRSSGPGTRRRAATQPAVVRSCEMPRPPGGAGIHLYWAQACRFVQGGHNQRMRYWACRRRQRASAAKPFALCRWFQRRLIRQRVADPVRPSGGAAANICGAQACRRSMSKVAAGSQRARKSECGRYSRQRGRWRFVCPRTRRRPCSL